MTEELKTFDEVIDRFFEQWWERYRLENSANVDQFKPVLKNAFKQGWLRCECFYEQ